MICVVLLHVFCFLVFSSLVQLVSATKCLPSLNCGDLGKISFPFTDTQHQDCGILIIHGCDDPEPNITKSIKNNNKWFDVVNIQQYSITITDNDLRELLMTKSCGVFSYDSAFTISSPFASSQTNFYSNLLTCNHILDPKDFNFAYNSTLCGNDTFYDIGMAYNNFIGCSMAQLPVSYVRGSSDIFDVITYEVQFEIVLTPDCLTCHNVHEGQCRVDSSGKFYCDQGNRAKIYNIVAPVASVAGALGVVIVLAWCFRRRICNKENPTHQIIEMFLKDHGHLAAKRYSYLEIKKATNSFRNKLGKGGYGSVYKGKLHDGSLVAVKVLSESKGNGEEFINEVASISVTSHVNIVTLLGFCLEGSKRALIYKYMPNGSVEKFIYKVKEPTNINLHLSCKGIFNIALGVARGLEYLHNGCNTKIVHFDIKPHNILLDEDFCPKISDFGLAKICNRQESIVSLVGTRGTAGYIAPEVFSRNFGGVSHKSDVYSYGMMVLEMVGGRNNMNVEVEDVDEECSSDLYFPHWIYKRLEVNQDLGLQIVQSESDKEMALKIIIVSLWCIQTDPKNRPTISKVVDMMERSLESLQIPPKPYLCSPLRYTSGSTGPITETCQTSYPSEY
ncbi:hypothetical protein Lal_00000171 [Lupinus albus]|uniref:Putative glycerophosphodiester phosphodiesterase, protein kinase RLK-Pelle-LRK10L-2 family n=1 Tax=Lupinus albus TaxID=3870 RepID=A0A6A4NP85_LUPAL|nr:putative glycerophosphodiester phosphodiesterase, protein kinase RLK-Pelle-LRK10L-2 family [Lupinus albus]KAF1860758.1 hypothetical protein Lal_00000171 [Lupinus albus]